MTSVTREVSVATFNLGISYENYLKRCTFLDPNFVSDEKVSSYRAAQDNMADFLTGQFCSTISAIYCFQGVGPEERPLLESLKDLDYDIFHYKGLGDTAIAIDRDLFEEVTDCSFRVATGFCIYKNVAMVRAIEKISKRVMVIVSGHVPECDLDNVFRGSLSERDEEAIFFGDWYCRAICEKLNEFGPDVIKIFGCDFNASKELLPNRFAILNEAGLINIVDPGAPTNVNPIGKHEVGRVKELETRIVDYIATNAECSLAEPLTSKALTIVANKLCRVRQTIGWDTIASDHLPVRGIIHIPLRKAS